MFERHLAYHTKQNPGSQNNQIIKQSRPLTARVSVAFFFVLAFFFRGFPVVYKCPRVIIFHEIVGMYACASRTVSALAQSHKQAILQGIPTVTARGVIDNNKRTLRKQPPRPLPPPPPPPGHIYL